MNEKLEIVVILDGKVVQKLKGEVGLDRQEDLDVKIKEGFDHIIPGEMPIDTSITRMYKDLGYDLVHQIFYNRGIEK